MTKLNFLLLIGYLLLVPFVYGQEISSNDCSNYNAFMNDAETMKLLNRYTLDIFPSGVMRINLAKTDEYGGVEGILELIDLPNGTTFELERMSKGRLNESTSYMRYQQYYRGIEVENGGYAIGTNGPDDDPCSDVSLLSVHFLSEVNIGTRPSIRETQLPTIIRNTATYKGEVKLDASSRAELVITQSNCENKLAWRVKYYDRGAKMAWVDANTGEVLRTEGLDMNLSENNTPTMNTYNSQKTTLNPEGPIFFYDITGFNCSNIPPDFLVEQVMSECPNTTTNPAIIQIAGDIGCVLQGFENIDVSFEAIHVGVGCDIGAWALPGSTSTEAFITFDNAFIMPDVVGHELGHAYINDFFGSVDNGMATRSLHEAISDMFGVFTESVCQGGVIDWLIGDDNNIPIRDLASPFNFTCFDMSQNSAIPHDRGEPLGHWFFLVSEGDENQNIPGLGINVAMDLVLNALEIFIPGDIPEFLDAVKAVTLDRFGDASEEAYAVWNAANSICVGDTWEGEFQHWIQGSTTICEEDGTFTLSVGGPLSGIGYRWYFPIEWELQYQNGTGNSHLGNYLQVNNLPDYLYYPQQFEVCVIALSTPGSLSRRCVSVTIQDCDGTDPGCNDIYGFSVSNEVNLESEIKHEDINEKIETIRVYDLRGVLVFKGTMGLLKNRYTNGKPRLYIASYFDTKGNWLHSEKIIHNFD